MDRIKKGKKMDYWNSHFILSLIFCTIITSFLIQKKGGLTGVMFGTVFGLFIYLIILMIFSGEKISIIINEVVLKYFYFILWTPSLLLFNKKEKSSNITKSKVKNV